MKLNTRISLSLLGFLFIILISTELVLTTKFKYKSRVYLKKLASSLMDTQTLSIKSSSISHNYENSNTFAGSVFITDNGDLSFSNNFHDNDSFVFGKKIIARARYTKSLAEIGWSRLYVETFDNTSPEIQSWAAGYLEGKLSAQEILYFYKNLVGIHVADSDLLGQVFNYYTKVESFIRKKTSKQELLTIENNEELRYWTSVAMIQAQTDGLLNGYNSVMIDDKFRLNQIYFINADGEVPELIEVFRQKNKSSTSDYSRFKQKKPFQKFSRSYLQKYFGTSDPKKVWDTLMMNSHCTALIKLIYDENDSSSLKDIMVAHTTWDSYSEMQRVYKIYKFSFTLLETQENPIISFSSYAGTLTSTDDFYLLNSGLVVLETTIEILDRSLYDTDLPSANEHVPNYIRISVANRLAKNGKQWTNIFKQNNSGTYNSQWMIIDLNRLKKEKKIHRRHHHVREQMPYINFDDIFKFKQDEQGISGLFYVLEQIPGHIEVKDMTDLLLKQKYWGSYNRPFFPVIYERAGYKDMQRRYGSVYSYNDNARAKLIRNKVEGITSLETLKHVMQSNLNLNNEAETDTISPRFDLFNGRRISKPSGGIDTKITNLKLGKDLSVLAISGPTHQNQKPFSWDDWTHSDHPHYGLPTEWNFDWVKMDMNFVRNSK